ncbi:MAG: T9SS C-terminal target domain-containing protein [Cryomorphaceae bacterium]|nr:MAG: T9SS C-terminal target domain-containing protein [Cryomorphaceae bacterium]
MILTLRFYSILFCSSLISLSLVANDCDSDIPDYVDTNSEAFQSVIDSDPFCCTTVWDGICQNAYNNYLPDGECVAAPSSVDTNSEAYQTVIANDPFCCTTVWDGICQNAYNNIGSGSGNEPDAGECIDPPSTVDVDSDAYMTVIANDPFCCTTSWDGICQNAYNSYIDSGNEPDDADCVTPPASVDTDSEAYDTVIANDPFCCTTVWDGICQNAYNNLIDTVDPDEEEDEECVPVPDTVDTSSPAYQSVIANDPFCCNSMWDGICQNAYNNYGGTNPDPDTDCIVPPSSVDTNSEAYMTVIANDPFCCTTSWDGICQNAYNSFLPEGECVAAPPEVDTNSEAYQAVITSDPFCCNTQWDAICQNTYDAYLPDGECVDPGEGVDTESDAYQYVISNDSFCCNYNWDNICQNAYNNFGGTIESPFIPITPVDDFTFQFFPNPSNGMIQIVLDNPDPMEPVFVRITGMTGQLLLSQQINMDTPGALYPMDVNQLASGMYLISVQHRDQIHSKPMVKQ